MTTSTAGHVTDPVAELAAAKDAIWKLRAALKRLINASWSAPHTKSLNDARNGAWEIYIATISDEERATVIAEAQRQQEAAPENSFLQRSGRIETFDDALNKLGLQLLGTIGL